jgi:hypothetical protein
MGEHIYTAMAKGNVYAESYTYSHKDTHKHTGKCVHLGRNGYNGIQLSRLVPPKSLFFFPTQIPKNLSS